jgi:hypothetical protein
MLADQGCPLTLQKVTDTQSRYLPRMNCWLEEIFPEYCPLRFDRLLVKLRPGCHQKLGGQTRADYRYPSGDLVVWYSLQDKYANVATPVLGEQLWQFGQLLESG